MKPILSRLLLAGCLYGCAHPQPVSAQEYKTHVSKEFVLKNAAASSVLSIYNIFRSIKVEGYPGDKVLLEIDEKLTAKRAEVLEQAKQECKLGFDQYGDTVIAYIAEPYDSRPRRYRDYWEDRRRIEYVYNLEFTVKVPFNMNLNISTVNNGEITVKDVAGSLRVHNVNGGILVQNAKDALMDIRTVNGNVTVNHLGIPPTESSYYTLNGRLEVTYPASLSADIRFKSMNGSFYTDFPEVQVLPARVTKTEEKKASGVIYKLNKMSDVRVGTGGKTYIFETLNGNIYIKKQS
ncbi:DUF4097 domain-containing protein [Sediminibacterium soli]|uniref:DUF4097 domain-containing protein n=1 Tax=Sediminibacterium soli TaxID=2698829 RepID=UPI00137B8A1F|nr:DUF4097 domain-containing protein [Sediminibacterium soli]NCI45650.1 DUF4097 domain-containing protein [Sediminibacterium soli]